jgi:TetR/AcrR family transcriptional regulator, transcriptional repressor for nem operon
MTNQEPAEPVQTRDRILHAAMTLFGEKGYGSTSIADILREAGVRSGSLYYFFAAKQDLLVAVLERYRLGLAPMLLDPAGEGIDDPIERVFALLARYRTLLTETEFFYGCPIGSIALELHEPDPPVRALLAANFDGWVAAIERCYRDAGERLPANMDRRALAISTLTAMEGGVMLSRTHRTIDAFDAAVGMLRDHIARLEAEAARLPAG